MVRKTILIVLLLVLIATPVMACPPAWLVDKVNYKNDYNYTEVNATCWQDSTGGLHTVEVNTTYAAAPSFLGIVYGHDMEYYTIKLDNKVIVRGSEDLTQKDLIHSDQPYITLSDPEMQVILVLAIIIIFGYFGMHLLLGRIPPKKD